MATRVVGLDLGSFGVRAVELSVGNGQPTLERFAQVTLPPGAVRDGEVVDAAAVTAAIRRLWTEGGFKSKKVVVGVANQRVIVRLADMQTMTEADLEAALQFEAQELIPIPVEDAILDFQILDEVVTTDGEPRMRVLLAAAQRDMVRSHLGAAEAAGLRVDNVDVESFALVRALTANANPFEFDGGAEAIVCIGGGVTNVVVHEQGIPRFVRVLLVGGDDITEAIARELDVPAHEAELLKRQADISSRDPGVARAGQVVRDRLAPLVEEIRGSLDYYLAQSQSTTIERILVSGGGSRMAGLMERLQAQLGAVVEPARPLAGLAISRSVGMAEAELSEIESLLTVPIGLALAGEPHRGTRRINLVPREVAVNREQRRQSVLAGAGVGALALVLLGAWGFRGAQLAHERSLASSEEKEAAALQHKVDSYNDIVALDADLATRRAQIQSVLANDVSWTKLFDEVSTVLPADTWLTSFTGDATGGKVNFAVSGFDHTSTAHWLQRIGEMKSLSGLWVPTATKATGPNGTIETFTSDANLTPAATSGRAKTYQEDGR